MKAFLTSALLLLCTLSLWGQEPPRPPSNTVEPVYNIIKLSPFHFAEGTFLLSYERMLGSEMGSSLMFSAGLHSKSTRNYTTGQPTPEFGFQEELQYRLYVVPPQDASRNSRGFWYFKGFYAGPFVYHRNLQRTIEVWDWILQQNVAEEENINEVAGGVVLGVQIALGNKFFMDFFTGGGIKRSFGDIRNDDFISVVEPGYNGVFPKIGFQIGIGL